MTPSVRCLLPVALALLSATPTFAQPVQKPGLWELVGTIKSRSGEVEKAMAAAQEQIAKLPAEQRRQIEADMAARGVSVGSDASTTVRMCLSAEDLARGNIPLQPGDCAQTITSREGNTLKVTFTCDTDPPAKGMGEIRQLTETSTLMTATVDTLVNGQRDRLNTTQKGTWVSESCGGLPSPAR